MERFAPGAIVLQVRTLHVEPFSPYFTFTISAVLILYLEIDWDASICPFLVCSL
jgi:hypothetical protein